MPPPDVRSAQANPGEENPTTGIDVCCARAASGHAAAPPTAAMKSRRLIPTPKGSEVGIVAI
jgi:hypothetical protein